MNGFPTKPRSLTDRIRDHWRPGINYHELMDLVFPIESYPRAYQYATQGGPPGCAMAFGAGLRRCGLWRDTDGKVLSEKKG